MKSMLKRAGRVFGAAAVGVAALAAAGCSTSEDRSWTMAPPATEAFSDGPAVDIENHRGTVEVRVEPWRKEIEVSMKTTIEGDGSSNRARLIREGMVYQAETIEQDGPAVLMVRAASPMPEDTQHWTTIMVSMPACGGVRVQNAGGKVMVINAGGATQIEVTDGAIEVRTDKVIDAPTLLTTTKGDIRWVTKPGTTGMLEAESADGTVAINNKAVGQWDWTATWMGPSKMVGTINSGTNPVSLRTQEGDITVLMVKDPNDHTPLMR